MVVATEHRERAGGLASRAVNQCTFFNQKSWPVLNSEFPANHTVTNEDPVTVPTEHSEYTAGLGFAYRSQSVYDWAHD